MNKEKILQMIDHTVLKPTTNTAEINKVCEESIQYKTASVCIPPNYVKYVKKMYGSELTICTVIGFPLGYNSTEVKVFEAKKAVSDGADEIDMVINLCDLKNKDYESITKEISKVKKAIGDKNLKVIVETCYLTEDEKIKVCQCVTDAKADYIKTSTGFGTSGAKVEDIELFKKYIGKSVKIKAAGGIRNLEDIEMYIKTGCDRIGTSSAVKILT